MALWWLLPAGVARVGLIGVPFPCGVGQTFGGVGRFGGFEAWQTAALNAYKRSHCCGRGVLLSHCCGLVVAFALPRWAWQGFKKDRIHTSGGPRRRPGLGEGRGRRIYIYIEFPTSLSGVLVFDSVSRSRSRPRLLRISFTHTIFHTQLCHTLSFTHNFVTHHLSHTQLCHTLSFTHNFFHKSQTTLSHTHYLSHTALLHTIFHT